MSSSSKPIISVVMTVYNGEPFLEEAVKGILGQTFSDFEFLIVDDASTDNSLAMIRAHAKKDARIKVIANEKNIGLTRSLIRAIETTEGEYIARQDSDDISLPQRLEKQLAFLEQDQAYGAVGTNASKIDESGRVIRKAIVPGSWVIIRHLLKFRNCFFHGSMMFRKADYLLAGGYRKFISMGQDYDLFLRMSKICKMKNLSEYLYSWRISETSVSSSRTDIQYKMGALALYGFRYNDPLNVPDDFEINNYINAFTDKERKRYNRGLRDLCIWQGNIKTAEEYFSDSGLFDYLLIRLSKLFFRIIRIKGS